MPESDTDATRQSLLTELDKLENDLLTNCPGNKVVLDYCLKLMDDSKKRFPMAGWTMLTLLMSN